MTLTSDVIISGEQSTRPHNWGKKRIIIIKKMAPSKNEDVFILNDFDFDLKSKSQNV